MDFLGHWTIDIPVADMLRMQTFPPGLSAKIVWVPGHLEGKSTV